MMSEGYNKFLISILIYELFTTSYVSGEAVKRKCFKHITPASRINLRCPSAIDRLEIVSLKFDHLTNYSVQCEESINYRGCHLNRRDQSELSFSPVFRCSGILGSCVTSVGYIPDAQCPDKKSINFLSIEYSCVKPAVILDLCNKDGPRSISTKTYLGYFDNGRDRYQDCRCEITGSHHLQAVYIGLPLTNHITCPQANLRINWDRKGRTHSTMVFPSKHLTNQHISRNTPRSEIELVRNCTSLFPTTWFKIRPGTTKSISISCGYKQNQIFKEIGQTSTREFSRATTTEQVPVDGDNTIVRVRSARETKADFPLKYMMCETNTCNRTETTYLYNISGITSFYNTTGTTCLYNTRGITSFYNTTGTTCLYNTSGIKSFYNTTGTTCLYNTSGITSFYNTTGTTCLYNTRGSKSFYNTTGTTHLYNTSGTTRFYYTSGTTYLYNTTGNVFLYNTTGTIKLCNTTGTTYQYNTTGTICTCRRNTIEDTYSSNTTGVTYLCNTIEAPYNITRAAHTNNTRGVTHSMSTIKQQTAPVKGDQYRVPGLVGGIVGGSLALFGIIGVVIYFRRKQVIRERGGDEGHRDVTQAVTQSIHDGQQSTHIYEIQNSFNSTENPYQTMCVPPVNPSQASQPNNSFNPDYLQPISTQDELQNQEYWTVP